MCLQIFLLFLDHKYDFTFVWDPCGQPSRKSVLTPVQTNLDLKGFTFYEIRRPTTIPQHVIQKEHFFLENSFLQHIYFLGSFRVPSLLQDSCLCIYRKNCPSPCEQAHKHFLLRGHLLVPVTSLLRGASSSQLIWPPHTASQEDSGRWKPNVVLSHWTSLLGNWVLETGQVGRRLPQNSLQANECFQGPGGGSFPPATDTTKSDGACFSSKQSAGCQGGSFSP